MLMVSAMGASVVACDLVNDEHVRAHAETVPFDAERLCLPITVVEIS
jgi:hypothetical protein